jgi:hypothetical protein
MEGSRVTKDGRNIRVVGGLVLSLTLGTATLMALEPPVRRWAPTAALAGGLPNGVQSVQIDYAAPGFDPNQFDALIFADGRCDWRPRGTALRVGVVGDGAAISEAQAQALLAALGSLAQYGLDLEQVHIGVDSDARRQDGLPPGAADLCRLLQRKLLAD